MRNIYKEIRVSLTAMLSLAIILCGLYPLAVWAIAQSVFPVRANGSLIMQGGKIIGSRLISQGFASPKYFHPRPSAAGQGYDASSSGGSNLGPLSRHLVNEIRQRISVYRMENNLAPDVPVPADAVTASGSGLDPDISLKNALFQAPRVARARGLSELDVQKQIKASTEGRFWGVLGEPRVNVLLLNLALDEYDRTEHGQR